MPKKRYRPEEIISKLREADVLISQGKCEKRKGGLPRPLITLSSVRLLLHPPPTVSDQPRQSAPQQKHRAGFGDGSVHNIQSRPQ